MTVFQGTLNLETISPDLPESLYNALISWRERKKVSLYTSGSTGEPSLYDLPDKLISWSAKSSKEAMGLTEDEQVFVCLPTHKVGGLMLVLRSILHKWHITIVEPSANPLKNIEVDHNFTVVSLVPYQLATIMRDEVSIKKLLQFRTVLLGGAPLSNALEKKLKTILPVSNTHFFHSYGMTETASHVALRNLRTMVPNVFKLLPEVDVGLNKKGCLIFDFPTLDYRVETEDLGEIEGRTIRFLSRIGDVVNSGGIKLHLHDIGMKIDNILDDNQLSARYFVWKTEDIALGEKLVFVGLESDNQTKVEQLLKQHLPKYEVPKDFYWVSAFKRNASGKIDRIKTVSALVEISG